MGQWDRLLPVVLKLNCKGSIKSVKKNSAENKRKTRLTFRKFVTTHKGITLITRETTAEWSVINNVALRI